MNRQKAIASILCILLMSFLAAEWARPALMQQPSRPPSLMEELGRGVVAVRSTATEVFVSWRLLGTDLPETAFNLYRATGGGAPSRLNVSPLTGATHFVDTTADLNQANEYFVRPIVFGLEQAAGASFTLPAAAPVRQYLRLPLQTPPGGATPAGEAYTYSPNDASVGDLDGDGEYEIIVKWDPSNAKDNSQSGYTGNVYLDAYKLDGARLWRIDLGRNIRAGAHYTQFQVYDLDGDGKAEVACKTADGTIDGLGVVIGDPAADYRNSAGYILEGPESLTIFSGQTGAALATASYVVPRGEVSAWGDNYGNRVDRFLAGVAYLDGQRPSLVMCRGYYTRAVIAAWNWRDGTLSNVWTFDTGHNGSTNQYAAWRGQGNHNLSIGDVDDDGKDEIMYGASAVDDDGTGLFSTGLGHGDAIHMSDMDPDRPGMEVFQPHESPGSYGPNAAEFRDARTGALIFGVQASGDIGRGLALDVDPRYRGYEMWASGSTGGMYTAQQSAPNAVLGPRGVQIASGKPSINFGVWWDGDLLRELLDGTTISKWNWLAGNTTNLLSDAGIASNNGTKATPALSADLFGDWREEVIWRETGNNALRIYTTTATTTHRIYTLMHDRQYREAIAWQNTGYNQPPHPSFYLGDGMAPPPAPNIVTSLDTLLGPPAPIFTAIENDAGASSADFITNDPTLILKGTSAPNTTVTVTRFGVGVIGSALAGGDGNWALDTTGATLPNGESFFTATATDAANRTGPATAPPFRVTIDLIPPAAPTIVDIADAGGLVFTGAAEPGSSVSVTLAGTGGIGLAVASASGEWTLSYSGPPLAAGEHSFTATATDPAGNAGPASAASTINTSLAAPVITTVASDTGASTNDGITTDNTLVLSGTAAASQTIRVRLVGGATLGETTSDGSGHWSFDYTGTPLADGVYKFAASVASGTSASASSPGFPVTIDTIAPAVVSVNRQNPIAAGGSADAVVFRATFSQAVVGVDATDFAAIFSGGLSGAITNVAPAGEGVFDVTVGSLSGEGVVRLDVVASGSGISDIAGNALSGGFAASQTFTRALIGNGVWIRDVSGGLWNQNLNWQNGVVGAGVGATADFSSLELIDDLIVRLDGPRTVGNLIFGDTDVGSPGDWIVDNNSDPTNVLTLAVGAGAPTVTVNALGVGATATLGASLAGAQGLTKLGPGPLVLTAPASLTGALAINGGALRLIPGSSMNIGAGAVNLGANSQFNIAGGSFTTTGVATAATSVIIIDSGSAAFGGFQTNSDFGGTLRINGGTLTIGDVNIRRNSAGTPDFNSGFIIAGGVATAANIGLGLANSNGAMSIEGGELTASGVVTIGNQATGGRGGAMRVTGGSFISTNTANGVVLCRTNGNNANNVASATFTGGVSQVEKFTLGFDSTVTAGSATITLNGGALYLGGGGIVKNGAAGLATNLNFGGGVLGAKADWGTGLPITLPANGNLVIKAADAANVAHGVTLAGVLSGPGALSKTGDGRLTLSAANVFTGPVAVNGGALEISGGLGAGADLAVNAGGILTGGGSIARAVLLNAGGGLLPGGSAPGSILTAASLTWNAGAPMAFDLGETSNRLALTGALTRGDAGPRHFLFTSSPGFASGASYTLATFGSTDLTASDLTFSGLPAGFTGAFTVTSNSIVFQIIGPPVIVTQPQSAVAPMGGEASFSVVAESPGILNYQWFKNNAAIAGATNASLTIGAVQASDIGAYSVTVSNAAGGATSNSALLSIAALILVNHAPSLNGGVIEGSIQQMLGENVVFNNGANVGDDLFLPGTPTIVLNGSPDFGGAIDGGGAVSPSNYSLTLNNNTTLGRLVRRTDPISLPSVSAPASPTGTRSVVLNNVGQSVGDWATVRNLTLNGDAGRIAPPPGAYGDFTANRGSGFILGVVGAVQPSVYHFQRLTLNGDAALQVVGPVIVVVANGFNISGVMGDPSNPAWLALNLSTGGLTLNSGAAVYGYVTAPGGAVSINGDSLLFGGLACDRFTINGNGRARLLKPGFEQSQSMKIFQTPVFRAKPWHEISR
jgi:autotransporter-associated beta strand protein